MVVNPVYYIYETIAHQCGYVNDLKQLDVLLLLDAQLVGTVSVFQLNSYNVGMVT